MSKDEHPLLDRAYSPRVKGAWNTSQQGFRVVDSAATSPFHNAGAAVRLTPSDQEKLLLSVAGMVARDRRDRGVRLNHPESVALLCCWVMERARDGDATVEQLMADGREVLSRADVMEGVADLLDEVEVEATFPDGRKLVTLHQPIA